ncbi:MAG: hypothetical protein IKF71_03490 [Bacilli bacterium]|nr:hypothetical protein [Bacilli bacterium]
MNRLEDFNQLREEYPTFIYHDYVYEEQEDLKITYHFEIPGLTDFYPTLVIHKSDIKITPVKEILEYLIFQIGLIECISYVKCTCSKNILIQAGYIDEGQIAFLKKLFYNGLGEFLYVNGISISEEDLFTIQCNHEKEELPSIDYQGEGNLICVGGGKDSCVSLELLKQEKNNMCLIINPKKPALSCATLAGYPDSSIMKVERNLDRKIIELNAQGFLNGHTPFSSVVAFISYLCAYLAGKENIVLSNESSANESTVLGTNINHQYSKTFEFEHDFREYMDRVMHLNISYFSLLRGLSEYNIAKLFSHYRIYHPVFRSCNLGSKEKDWKWCCNCSKCLFIYIILSPFLTKVERINIFGQDLYQREDLLEMFQEILGYSKNKPFECVGTYEEARYAVSQVVQKGEEGYLLDYYREHYPLELDGSFIEKYNEENHLDEQYNTMIKKELDRYV